MATVAAVEGLAVSFSGEAGARVEVPGVDVGPLRAPKLTMGCWARPLSFNQGSGFDAAKYDRMAKPTSMALSGSREGAWDRAFGIRSWGVDQVH